MVITVCDLIMVRCESEVGFAAVRLESYLFFYFEKGAEGLGCCAAIGQQTASTDGYGATLAPRDLVGEPYHGPD